MAQINKPSDYFNTLIYTGDGTDNRSITGLGFQPDFCWFKDRTGTNSHNLFDSVRGVQKPLISNSTSAELSGFDLFDSFDSDGFTISGSTADNTNYNGNQFASWNWLAGGTASSNTDGSITSSVSANTTSGFSIVSYTGTGSNATVGHGLGTAPAVVLVKGRGNAHDWMMYHHKNTSEPATDYIRLNLTNATTDNVVVWNDTAPTSSVFSIGTSVAVNENTTNFIAYCFAEKKGFSKAFSYTGNGSADGSFVFCGFRPAFVMIKRTDAAYDWIIYDNKRDTFNPINKILKPNTSDAEVTPSIYLDLLSNGFKLRTTDITFNASGGSYIGLAFAESPLVGTNNIPATAR